MKDYLRWLLRQLYLLYFWPTRFEREVEGGWLEAPRLRFKERAVYMLRMMPWVAIIGIIANLVFGIISQRLGINYRWERAWVAVAVGAAGSAVIGAAFGAILGVAFGIASGVGFGVMFGLMYGVRIVGAGSVAGSIAGSVVRGAIVGAGGGLLLSTGSSAVRGALLRVASCMAFGTFIGITSGIELGVAGGLAVGIACNLLFCLSYFRLFSYPLDVALSSVAYLYGKKRPLAIKQAWQLCPVRWNEVIWLPLPFAAKLLVMLTMQDREEGFRQIAFVAAERRLQKRVALRAAEEIAINDLHATSINRMATIPRMLEWTTDAPAELSSLFDLAFPRFERIAHYAGQYLMLHSDHRKGEALKQALAELTGLQKSLISARGRLAPRLLQTANEWRALLEAKQKAFATKLTATQEIANPFAFGNALGETKDNIFVGRRDIARKIEDSILGTNQTPTLLLQGARRMGKSSILNQLPRMLGPDFAPVVIDCQEAAFRESKAAMLRYLSRAISTGLQRQRVKVNALTRQALEREPFSVFKDWLEDVERVWPQNLRMLLCFDEYERLQETLDAGWGHGFLDTLRNWIQHHPQLVLMFTGAHAFEELGPAWTDRFISARRMRVSFLAREDLELLLSKPIPEFDMTYRDGALDAIIHTTNGQPFLTQAVAFELVQHLNEQCRKEATPEDVEAAIAHALVSGSAYFHNVWTDAREQGQAILNAIARGDAPPDYPAARIWLRENDVLNEADDFAVPMVRRWVSETKIHQNPAMQKSDS